MSVISAIQGGLKKAGSIADKIGSTIGKVGKIAGTIKDAADSAEAAAKGHNIGDAITEAKKAPGNIETIKKVVIGIAALVVVILLVVFVRRRR